ncbi:hypothetical protein V9T40_001817 [Parthenolecanium corni]|uniref:Nephrin/kirre n=1 Tax=Parthenolecanium corni TaxID=536013 RepID=A0AAN9TJ79_9HEMI
MMTSAFIRSVVPPGEPSVYDENGNNLVQGTSRAYEEGATMTLKCVSRGGRPRPQLQWWHEGTLLESHSTALPNDVDPDASSAVITVTNLNRSHFHTTYSCQAFNNNVTAPAARSVVVNMFLAPLDVLMTSNASMDERFSAERTYTVECRAIGSVPPAKITWWKNDQLVDDLPAIETFVENASISVLTFVPTREDNGVFLKCSATNPNVKVWRKEASIKLNVEYAPDVSLVLGPELKADDIKEDQDVYFNCDVDANPPIYKLVWKHNGVDIQQNVKNEIRVNGKSLVLRSVKKESMGNYSCVASNVEGDKKSNSVELRVSYKPVCKPNQKLVYGAARDENIQVVCEVDSNPEPDTFKWSFNHSQQPIPDKYYSRVDKRRGISILTFTPKSEMDFGYLTCSATNQVGSQVLPCHFQVIPAAAPYSPHNCTIGNVTTVSLEVRCREGFDGGLEQSFWLEVINSTTGSVVLNVSSQEPYFKLSKLAPGNSVQVKVYAANVKGRSQPFELEGSTLKAEKHTGPQNAFVTPLLGIAGCVSVLLIVLILGLCLTKCTAASLRKSTRRPTSLCIKEKATHASLLENHERDEKDPDLIPVKKSTGYQVLRTDSHMDEDITKSMTLPASSIQLRVSDETDLVSDDEQLSFIDRSEKLQTSSSVKDNISYVNGDNT